MSVRLIEGGGAVSVCLIGGGGGGAMSVGGEGE